MTFSGLGAISIGGYEDERIPVDVWEQARLRVMARPFWVVEVDATMPGSIALTYADAIGSAPAGAVTLTGQAIVSTWRLTASDLGYISRATDAPGVAFWPPILSSALDIDRQVNFSPDATSAGFSWGRTRLMNADRQLDGTVRKLVTDQAPVRIYLGSKSFDEARGIWIDPPLSALERAFVGVTKEWVPGDGVVDLPLRDATYALERPLQARFYGGTGGLDGSSSLAGMPLPKTRGGTALSPVLNVRPVLVDEINRIYQYTDARGSVVALYENGFSGFTYDGDVATLDAWTAPGHYRTDNSRGLFQLGTDPKGDISCDVTGDFPTAGAISDVIQIALYLMLDDLALSSSLIDISSWTGASAAYGYTGGIYVGPDQVQAIDVIADLLGSIAGKLIASRVGLIRPFILRAPIPDARPVATYTAAEIISITRLALPETLVPPPYRWRVMWGRNNTPTTSGISELVDTARRQWLSQDGSYASWMDASLLLSYRNPGDPAPQAGALLREIEAAAVAQDLGALWSPGDGRRVRALYDVTLPGGAFSREIGDYVTLDYAIDSLDGGRLGTVVGVAMRSADALSKITVLI